MPESSIATLVAHQRDLFAILDEFFLRATGTPIEDVGDPADFALWVRRNGARLAPLGPRAFEWVEAALAEHYSAAQRRDLYGEIRSLPGVKLVFGGGSRFTAAHLATARRVLLYCDTLLIPDPVLPWLEAPRPWERFKLVQRLQAAFTLLHLKPFVDADLPYPAIIVFPSWEKSLEIQDVTTQRGQEALVTGVMSSRLGVTIATHEEMRALARERPEEVLAKIEEEHLFVAPGEMPGLPLAQALPAYRTFLSEWRSDDFVHGASKLSDAELAVLGTTEWLSPQYHLIENADELTAHPLLALPSQSHYFQLTAGYLGDRAKRLGLLDDHTLAEVRAINFDQFQWLGDVPIGALVELRVKGENETFRARLREHTSILYSASLEDLDRVAGEVARGIESLLREHQETIRALDSKYTKEDVRTVLLAGLTVAAPLIPALAPLVGGVALLAPLGKLAWDRMAERLDRKAAAGALMGVLGHARGGRQTN